MKLKAYRGTIVVDVIALGVNADDAKKNAGWAMAIDPLGPDDALATGVTWRATGAFTRSPDDDYGDVDEGQYHANAPARLSRDRYYLTQPNPFLIEIRDRTAGDRLVREYGHGTHARIAESLQRAQRDLAAMNAKGESTC